MNENCSVQSGPCQELMGDETVLANIGRLSQLFPIPGNLAEKCDVLAQRYSEGGEGICTTCRRNVAAHLHGVRRGSF